MTDPNRLDELRKARDSFVSRLRNVRQERSEVTDTDDAQQNGDATPAWIVSAKPEGSNPELKPDAAKRAGRKRLTGKKDDKDYDNVGGVIVYVERTRGSYSKEEVARVGWVREASENPDVPFKQQLDKVLQDARDTVDVLNKLQPEGDLL